MRGSRGACCIFTSAPFPVAHRGGAKNLVFFYDFFEGKTPVLNCILRCSQVCITYCSGLQRALDVDPH
jgi:hypothetical protein